MLITSLQNPRIRQVLKLKTSRGRKANGLTLIDGSREVSVALHSGAQLQEIFFCPECLDQREGDSLLKQLISLRIPLQEVSAKVYRKISFGEREDGLLAVCRPHRHQLDNFDFTSVSLCLVLEGIEKPGNLGAILRTCDAAGVQALLVTEVKTDIFHPNVIRASVGTVFRIPVITCGSSEARDYLKKNRIQIVSTVCQSEEIYTDVDFRDPTAIVLGSEEKGLSLFWKEQADRQVKIPMQGIADSLNVSVSAALLVYEVLRQRSVSS